MEKARDVKDATQDKVGMATDKAGEMKDKTKDKAGDMKEAAKDKASGQS